MRHNGDTKKMAQIPTMYSDPYLTTKFCSDEWDGGWNHSAAEDTSKTQMLKGMTKAANLEWRKVL